MPLTDDQRAMLRLLAQREEGYEDIAALKGLSVDEVRAEVKEALAQLAADREAGLEPPPAPEPTPPEAPTEEKTPAAPPKPKREGEEPSPVPVKPSAPARPVRRPSRPAVPPERRRLVALAGGALGVVALILIAVTVFSDGSGSSSGSAGANGSTAEPAIAEDARITQAALEPVNGGDASGRAIFGRVKKTVALRVEASGLEPASGDESYAVWLYRTPKERLPIGASLVGESGRLVGQFPISAEVLAYLAAGVFDQIAISRTDSATLAASLRKGRRQNQTPAYTGTDVLLGTITGPITEAKTGAARR